MCELLKSDNCTYNNFNYKETIVATTLLFVGLVIFNPDSLLSD